MFDKGSGRLRPAKTGNVAIETDLYTYRVPRFPEQVRTLEALSTAIREASNKDRWVESDKAEMETRGLRALAALEKMPAGSYRLTEDERVDAVAYVALLLAQHPTMMRRRSAAASQRFWAQANRLFRDDSQVGAIFEDLGRGDSVLGLIPDQLLLALELDYLAWSVVRWQGGPTLVLGDNAVVASFPGSRFGIGDAWTTGATFMVPISPSTALFLGGFDPGLCLVEDRSSELGHTQVPRLNVMSWARAEREVYARTREDLEAGLLALDPVPPRQAWPDQLAVRESVLPDFVVDAAGRLQIVQPNSPLDDDTAARFRERLDSSP